MDYVILLDSKTNFREVASEEQTKFILSIVEALGIPFEWDSNVPFGVLETIRLRKTLNQYNVGVIDDMEGGTKIYLDNKLVAEWKKTSYMLKEDISQIDPKKKLYIEMKCSFQSMFEEEADSS